MKQFVKKIYYQLPLSLQSNLYNTHAYLFKKRRARLLAATSKKLEVCAAQIAHLFHRAHFAGTYPVKEKVCLEVGSGWVLTHSLIFYLLGAKEVIATDIEALAYPEVLAQSLQNSTISLVRDILSPFEDHDLLRKRLNNLLSIKHFSFQELKKLSIKYHAPIDFSKQSLGLPVDFIFSNSTLEHVFIDEIAPLLANITKDLTVGGHMLHGIHLEDHLDIQNKPFDFLSESGTFFTASMQRDRGNRIRTSEWYSLFSNINNLDFQLIYEWQRSEKFLPAYIDESITFANKKELCTSHIGILGTKK
jgi:hypothetical protein